MKNTTLAKMLVAIAVTTLTMLLTQGCLIAVPLGAAAYYRNHKTKEEAPSNEQKQLARGRFLAGWTKLQKGMTLYEFIDTVGSPFLGRFPAPSMAVMERTPKTDISADYLGIPFRVVFSYGSLESWSSPLSRSPD